MVRRKRCPETSCPFLSLGVVFHDASGMANGEVKSEGCVAGDIVVFV